VFGESAPRNILSLPERIGGCGKSFVVGYGELLLLVRHV